MEIRTVRKILGVICLAFAIMCYFMKDYQKATYWMGFACFNSID